MARTGPSHSPLATALVCLGVVSIAGTVQLQSHCAPSERSTEFKCENGSSIFPVRGLSLEGPQPDGSCPSGWEPCPLGPRCCGGANGRGCASDLDNAGFAQLVFSDTCWDRTSCTVTQANRKLYIGSQYLCLTEHQVRSFSAGLSVETSAMALFYTPQQSSISPLHCHVDTPTCTPVSASVLLVKKTHDFISENCTSLKVSGESWLECSEKSRYQKHTDLQTPFSVVLRHSTENDAEVWAVVYARNGATLNIACEVDESSISKCSSPITSTPTRPSSGPGIKDPAISKPTDSSFFPSSTADIAPGSVEPQSGFDLTLVIAVVLPVVVIGALVILVVLCRRKRRGSRAKTTAVAAVSPAGYATQSPSPASPTSAPTPSNAQPVAMATSESDRDADYDVLGVKRQAAAPCDVTYGHLGMGDVIGGDYDHVGRWQKSAPSADVISNVYSTAAAVVTSQSEDASNPYDVAGAPRPDVINSPYDCIDLEHPH